MWKYYHKWFGWEYILFDFCFKSTIARVKTFPNGQKYVAFGDYKQFLINDKYLADGRRYRYVTEKRRTNAQS